MEYGSWEQNRQTNFNLLQQVEIHEKYTFSNVKMLIQILFEDDQFTDVFLLVDGQTFPAHRVIWAYNSTNESASLLASDQSKVLDKSELKFFKVILAAHSQYFLTMFTCGMTETRKRDLYIFKNKNFQP